MKYIYLPFLIDCQSVRNASTSLNIIKLPETPEFADLNAKLKQAQDLMIELACEFEDALRSERDDYNSHNLPALRVAAARKSFEIVGLIALEKRTYELAVERHHIATKDFARGGMYSEKQVAEITEATALPDEAEHKAKIAKFEADLEVLNAFVASRFEFDLDGLRAIIGDFDEAMQPPPKVTVNSIPVTRWNS